jgi:hypothetical protein
MDLFCEDQQIGFEKKKEESAVANENKQEKMNLDKPAFDGKGKEDREEETELDKLAIKETGKEDRKEEETEADNGKAALEGKKQSYASKKKEPTAKQEKDRKQKKKETLESKEESCVNKPNNGDDPKTPDFKAAALDVLRIAEEKAKQEEERRHQLKENQSAIYVIPNLDENTPNNIVDKEVSQIVMAGNGASLEQLLSVVQMIPRSMIIKMYKVSITEFANQLNKRLSSTTKYNKRARDLLEILNKYKMERETEEKIRSESESTGLPEYLAVPCTTKIKDCFSSEPENSHLLFKVHETEGDGNCLYRALSNSKNLTDEYPFMAGDHEKLRQQMHKLADLSTTLPEMIHESYSNARDKKLTCKEWIKSMSVNKKWGGRAEIIWFAYCMKIHVVCVSVLSARVYVLRTQGLDKLSKIPVTSIKKPKFHLQLTHPNELIFLWHHDYDKPWKFNGVEDDPDDPIVSNHYSLIEFLGYSSPKSFPSRTLLLPHRDV